LGSGAPGRRGRPRAGPSAGAAYTILARLLINHEGADWTLARAFGREVKGLISVAGYVAGIVLSFVEPRISMAIYVAVALLWLVPDRRIEKRVAH
jgi:hypothetical protein